MKSILLSMNVLTDIIIDFLMRFVICKWISIEKIKTKMKFIICDFNVAF